LKGRDNGDVEAKLVAFNRVRVVLCEREVTVHIISVAVGRVFKPRGVKGDVSKIIESPDIRFDELFAKLESQTLSLPKRWITLRYFTPPLTTFAFLHVDTWFDVISKKRVVSHSW
jgi:hypothetical protein